MDYGPEEKQGRDYQSVLRKRVATKTIDNDSIKDFEAHVGKRGKVEVMTNMQTRYRHGWIITLARSNETIKMELPRAWEILDSS